MAFWLSKAAKDQGPISLRPAWNRTIQLLRVTGTGGMRNLPQAFEGGQSVLEYLTEEHKGKGRSAVRRIRPMQIIGRSVYGEDRAIEVVVARS